MHRAYSQSFRAGARTAERTKHLVKGSRYVGEPCDNKFIVKALREIAAGKVRLKNDLEAIHQIQEEL